MPTGDKTYDVSVILCSYNRADQLERTLQSLRQVSVPEDWNAEILLIDNASTDATPEVMRTFNHPEMPVRVVCEEKQGLSHARNRGVEEARGQIFLFTDDDVRFPPGWIEGMGRPILDGSVDAVAGGVELAEERQEKWMTARHRELLASTERIDSDQPDRVVGANMAIARWVFDRIPGFDPMLGAGQLGSGEETLLSWQIREAGLEIGAQFDVVVEHHPHSSRLSREGFCQAARKRGYSQAHINYHWRHHTDWRCVTLLAGLAYWGMKLGWWRLCNLRRIQKKGMAIEEVEILKRLYRVRQHLTQWNRNPKYTN